MGRIRWPAMAVLCALLAWPGATASGQAPAGNAIDTRRPPEVRPVLPRNEENTEREESDARAVERCRAAPEGATVLGPILACLRGLIDQSTMAPLKAYLSGGEEVLADPNLRKVLVIDSPGGSITHSLELGRAIHATKIRLVVDRRCFSSCANYIVPAAFILIVWDRSIIALHGSAPRRPQDFTTMMRSARGISREAILKDISILESIYKEWPAFHEKFVIDETKYFGQLDEDENYLHHYFAVKRNLMRHATDRCKPKKGLNLIVGPGYVDHFLLSNVGYFWWPEDTKEIFDVLQSYGMDYTFVLDLDIFPSWVPGIGFVDQSTCVSVPGRKYGTGAPAARKP